MTTTASEIFLGLSILTLGALVMFVYYDLKKTMLGRPKGKTGRRVRARRGKSPEEEQADSGRVQRRHTQDRQAANARTTLMRAASM